MADEDVIEQEEVDDSPPFSIIDGSTYYRRKKEWDLFADFSLKILGEITEGGLWVCAFGARVLGRHVERGMLHFTVVGLVTWPLNGKEAELTLFRYRPHCFYCANQVVLMLSSLHLHEKSREVCIKARSTPASLAVMARRIVIPASAFDGKVKFLEKTRKSFGGGTFNISEGALLESYYSFLKDEYYEEKPRQYYAAECIGLQPYRSDYWCLSKEIHVLRSVVLPKENQLFLFTSEALEMYEVHINHTLLEDQKHCLNVCKRFIEASAIFGVNESSVKLATAFMLLRILRINDEESWNESSIGLLHSSIDERNVGKSLTLDLLAKGQGVATRKHPTMLAGGDQNQCGASVPVIRDTLSRTNLIVMIDDPVISTNLAELLLQVQSGLTMGSRNAGVGAPGGSLLLTSNSCVTQRAEGRVLVFEYRKAPFSIEAEKALDVGIKKIVAENTGFLLAWAIRMKRLWQQVMPDIVGDIRPILDVLLTKMQPRWAKGMAGVIATHAIFHASVGINPDTSKIISEVLNQNMTVQKESTITRLQRSILSKLETDESNVLCWINPLVKVSVKDKFVMSIGIKASVLEGFSQISVKEIGNWLREVTDCRTSMSISFASSESCTFDDLKKRNEKCKSYRGWKVPFMFLTSDVLEKLKERCGSSLFNVNDDHRETSSDGQGEVGEVASTSAQASKFEDFQDQLHALDLYLLKYFKDNEPQLQEGRDTETMEIENFKDKLTPESKKVFSSCTPKSRSFFKKGFEAATRLQVEQATSCSNALTVQEQTPVPANRASEIAGSRKRLFSPGCIGVLPREAKTSKQEVCAKCNKQSPYKKKDWSGLWIMCDTCSKWYHKECTNVKTVPKDDEKWECRGCEKKP